MWKLAEYYFEGHEYPFYVKWFIWCWHKPIYIGLPLMLFTIPLAIGELLLLFVIGLSHWGGKQDRG